MLVEAEAEFTDDEIREALADVGGQRNPEAEPILGDEGRTAKPAADGLLEGRIVPHEAGEPVL